VYGCPEVDWEGSFSAHFRTLNLTQRGHKKSIKHSKYIFRSLSMCILWSEMSRFKFECWVGLLRQKRLLCQLSHEVLYGRLLLLYYSYICTPEEPYGSSNGGLLIPMWECVSSSDGHGSLTNRITIVLDLWQTSDNVTHVMFGTSSELLNCSMLTSAKAENLNSALSPTALMQA
jgi:hypothetical protein